MSITTNSENLKSKLGLTAILNSLKLFVSYVRDAFSFFYSLNSNMHLLEEKIKRVLIPLRKSDNKIFHELKMISSYLWLIHLLLSNFLNFSDVVNYFQFQKGNEENKLFYICFIYIVRSYRQSNVFLSNLNLLICFMSSHSNLYSWAGQYKRIKTHLLHREQFKCFTNLAHLEYSNMYTFIPLYLSIVYLVIRFKGLEYFYSNASHGKRLHEVHK